MEPDNRLWNPDGGEAEWLRLIDFINPGSKAIKGVLAQAKSKAPNGEFPAYVPPDGWSGTIKDLANLQVEAIYETLRTRRIGYAVERWDSEPSAQVIRTHEEILDPKGIGGPCIDLVVLMAACLEAVGIQPLVVVLEEEQERKRHAVLGYRLLELHYGPETPACKMPPSLLTKQELHALKNKGQVEFINCTGITRGETVDFKEAQKQGKGYVEISEPDKRHRYKEHWQVIFVLDVQVGRRTALTREMEDYLQRVKDDALTLPPAFGFPPGSGFPRIRVRVKVRQGPRRFSEAEARAWERDRREGALEREETAYKVYQYPRPLLEDLEREAERPLDWDRNVRRGIKRAVILGDPGFGKTWLLKHEALKLSEDALKKLEEHPLATDEIELPIFLPLAQLAEQTDEKGQLLPIDEALLPALKRRYHLGNRLETWIKRNLNSERFLLLLDALDEVPAKHKETLCGHLNDFTQNHDQTRIILTSRLVGYPGAPFPLPRDGEFELLPFDRRQQREFVQKWFHGGAKKANLFLRGLRGTPQPYTLAGVPLLLALMCRLFDESDELPKSRAKLYEACIWGILTRKWKTWRSQDDPSLHAKLRLVQEVAYELFTDEKKLFYLNDLLNIIEEIFRNQPRLEQNLQNKSPAALIAELQEDGLLIKAGVGVNRPHLFLHLIFQEYLTACALAQRTELVQLNGEKVPEWLKLVKPHLFDPRWEEVIRLLASKFEDATPLIQKIWQPGNAYRGQLHLAGKCLWDAQDVQPSLHKAIIDHLLTPIRSEFHPRRTPASVCVPDGQILDPFNPPNPTDPGHHYYGRWSQLMEMLAILYDEVFEELVFMLNMLHRLKMVAGGGSDPLAHAISPRRTKSNVQQDAEKFSLRIEYLDESGLDYISLILDRWRFLINDEAISGILDPSLERYCPGQCKAHRRTRKLKTIGKLHPTRMINKVLLWKRENEELCGVTEGFLLTLIFPISVALGYLHIKVLWGVILVASVLGFFQMRDMAKLGWLGKKLAARLWWREALLNQRLELHVEAAKCFEKAHQFDPRFPAPVRSRYDLLFESALYHIWESHDYKAAIPLILQAIYLQPRQAKTYSLLGLTYEFLYDYDEAESWFEKAIALNPTSKQYFIRGSFRLIHGLDTEGAIRDLSQAIGVDPSYANAYCYRAAAYHELSDDKAAQADLTKAQQLTPESVDAQALLEWLLVKLRISREHSFPT